MPFPEDIYDLYNTQLTTDQPYVDTCVSAIKTQIASTVAANGVYDFNFDLTPYIGSLDIPSQIRIKDRIIFTFRAIGIGCFLLWTGTAQTPNITSSSYQPWGINFNSQYITTSLVVKVRWFVRNDTEFGKSYV
jgi:hypothetical protein